MEHADNLRYSNVPIYLPSFLKQYGKEVQDYRQVNWESSLPSYQLQFLPPESLVDPVVGKVNFAFMGKNCWLWDDEYCLLKDILPRVEQMTIRYNHQLGVGPMQSIWDKDKPLKQLVEEGIERQEQDLLSGYFRVQAVLRPV